MDVTIRYCAICGYRGRAERLRDAIREHVGVEAVLEHGGLGQFDVLADGDLVASREHGILNHLIRGGFPDDARVVETLTRLAATHR
jgi:selT/selW/selH-like putative selenoprotein